MWTAVALGGIAASLTLGVPAGFATTPPAAAVLSALPSRAVPPSARSSTTSRRMPVAAYGPAAGAPRPARAARAEALAITLGVRAAAGTAGGASAEAPREDPSTPQSAAP